MKSQALIIAIAAAAFSASAQSPSGEPPAVPPNVKPAPAATPYVTPVTPPPPPPGSATQFTPTNVPPPVPPLTSAGTSVPPVQTNVPPAAANVPPPTTVPPAGGASTQATTNGAKSEPSETEVVSAGGGSDAAGASLNGGHNGTWVRDMALNDLLQILARRLGLQYFYNPKLNDIRVSGSLTEKVPSIKDIEEMALQYDVLVDGNGRTLMAFSRDQLASLPKSDYVYTLKYLRPNTNFFTPTVTTSGGETSGPTSYQSDPGDNDEGGNGIGENFKALLKPALSATGSVSYEPKTNQLIISDNQYSLSRAIEMLDKLDVPKKQIIVQVRILRLNSNAANYSGVDWSQTLGANGLQIGATAVGPLNEIFSTTPVFGDASTLASQAVNAAADAITGNNSNNGNNNTTTDPDNTGTGTGTSTTGTVGPNGGAGTNAGIILSPLEVNVVLRALLTNDLATQESGPAVITEDNEPAIFRVVDRIPIVEQSITDNGGSGNPILSTDVRYRIDKSDPIDPANSREVGVSVAVTPGLLPDNTIRMKLLPRVASITQYTKVYTGFGNIYNEYPNVNETTVEARARIPDGYTLVLGGYYQDQQRKIDNKVPFLGDIPGLSYAFRSTSREKVRSNIVFLITPTSYDPSSIKYSVENNEMLRQNYVAPKDSKYPDPDWPKEDSKSNIGQRLANLLPFFKKKPKKDPSLLSPENPQNQNMRPVVTKQQKNQMQLEQEIRGTDASPQE